MAAGGGSPHDAAKGIGIVASNGGEKLMPMHSSLSCHRLWHASVLFRSTSSDPSEFIVRLSVGSIKDYEGVDKMHTAMPPVVRVPLNPKICHAAAESSPLPALDAWRAAPWMSGDESLICSSLIQRRSHPAGSSVRPSLP